MPRNLGDALHHVGAIDTQLAKQANDPISRRRSRSFTRESPRPAQTAIDSQATPAIGVEHLVNAAATRRFDRSCRLPSTRQLSTNRRRAPVVPD